MNPLLNSARSYAQRGWQVIPLHSIKNGVCTCGRQCKSPAKHPRTFNGLTDATAELDTITSWWTLWPDSNIGIITGSVSGLVVVDIDDPDIAPTFPDTVECRTGSGGKHLYYRHPGGHVKSSVKIAPGTDSRADGGYVVAPPSMHISGERYQWVEGPNDTEMAMAPNWWIDLLEKKRSEPVTEPGDFKLTEGGRNNRLTQKAGHMRRAGFDEPAIAAALHDYNRRNCEPPLDDDEIDQIAKSVGSYDTVTDEDLARIQPFLDKQRELENQFQLLTLDQFNLEEPEQIVRGMLEPDSLCMIYGPSGVGKSFFTLDLSLSIACGAPYHGREVKQGPVVYLAGEGHRGVVKRSLAWGIDRGQNVTKSKFYLARRPFDLLSVESTTSVVRAIETILDGIVPSVVVIDTLARNFGDGDENSTQDMGRVIKMLDELRLRFPGVCIIIVHHSGHTGERARGSSALRGAVDTEYQVMGEEGRLEVTNTKMKDGTPPSPMAFELVDVELGGVDYYGEPVKSAFCRSVESEAKKEKEVKKGVRMIEAENILKILHAEMGKDGVTKEVWIERYREMSKDPQSKRTCEFLIKSGIVTQDQNSRVRFLISLG